MSVLTATSTYYQFCTKTKNIMLMTMTGYNYAVLSFCADSVLSTDDASGPSTRNQSSLVT